MDRRVARFLPYAPLVFATALLAHRSLAPILQKLGHPGATLDDAYIHFQYARAFAEGHPFRFQAGEPISTGATSFLWPMLLAPFYLVGFHGESILWPAWVISFVALGALAYECYRLTLPLAGRAGAVGAGAMTLAFGGLAWCAASGMEVVPFAWLIAYSTRRAAEWAEGTRRNWRVMLGLGIALPLMRPEGALTTMALAAIVAIFPTKRRLEALPIAATAFVPQILLLILTGSMTSSTAQVKLLFGNPYYTLPDAALSNARTLVGQILDGQVWSAEFLPKGGAALACVGLLAIVWRGHMSGKLVRASLILLFALSMFVPCFYVTFLWNRLRYLWPFAPGWFMGLACLARAAADIANKLIPRYAPAIPGILAGAFAGTMLVRLDWVLEDAAQSASGIDRQQAELGRWAAKELPADARIGVNDTGAIAYFSDRKTFDVVGLTTPTEGKYWVGGQGSRFEHYEKMQKANPRALPTHFIVYPEWMACAPLMGKTLTEATVTDSTILGGQTMRASEANFEHFGSGEMPWTKMKVDDAIDVADLEDEKAHDFELVGLREGDETVEEGNNPDGDVVLDGGRTNRTRDRFRANTTGGSGVVRIEVDTTTGVKIFANGAEIAHFNVESGPWIEVPFEIPQSARGERTTIDVTSSEAVFTSYHYWFGSVLPTAAQAP
jgi:hypothetical protein